MKNDQHYLILIIIILFSGVAGWAQAVIPVTEGVIGFERTVNKFALIQSTFDATTSNTKREEFARYKNTHPQFLVQKSELRFSKNSSLFIPSDENDQVQNTFYGNPIAEQYNVVSNDFRANQSLVRKRIIGNTYLLADSARSITWKLTDETREIAGYTCRRANGVMLDSIFVVAFYTERIAVQGGPESFHGLPGMILGAVLPAQHVNWFATKVVVGRTDLQTLQPPTGGKRVSFAELVGLLKNLNPQKQVPIEFLY